MVGRRSVVLAQQLVRNPSIISLQNVGIAVPLVSPYELRAVVLQSALGLTAVLVLLFGQHTILAAERFNRSFPEWFDEGEYVASKAGGQPTTVHYRLFRPTPFDPAVRYPLLIWMHGEGEAGDDNSLQLRWLDLVFRVGTTRADYPFFVLATQCPSGQRAWAASGNGPPEDHSGHAENAADSLAVTYGVFKRLPTAI